MAETLTKEHLAEIRKGIERKWVGSIHYTQVSFHTSERGAFIKVWADTPGATMVLVAEIEVDARITNFSSESGPFDCYVNGWGNSLPSIFRLVKPGDLIQLEWVRDNTNQILRDQGMARDELHLHIIRNGMHHSVFLVDVVVLPYSSSARLVRMGMTA